MTDRSTVPPAPTPTTSRVRDDAGMTTAEYAVGTVGACGFAGLLYQLLTSDFGRQLLQHLFDKVLTLLPF
jgi:hypothetical protein